MKDSEIRVPDYLVEEIFLNASRSVESKKQEYNLETLIAAGEEVGIPEEIIRVEVTKTLELAKVEGLLIEAEPLARPIQLHGAKLSESLNSGIDNASEVSFLKSHLPIIITGVIGIAISGMLAVAARYERSEPTNQVPVVQTPYSNPQQKSFQRTLVISPKPNLDDIKQTQIPKSQTDKLFKTVVPFVKNTALLISSILIGVGLLKIYFATKSDNIPMAEMRMVAVGLIAVAAITMYFNMFVPAPAINPSTTVPTQQTKSNALRL